MTVARKIDPFSLVRAWCDVCGATKDGMTPLAADLWLRREHSHADDPEDGADE